MNRETHKRVALVGAPCSGKSTVFDILRNELYRFPNPRNYQAPAYLDEAYWKAVDNSYLLEDTGCILDENNQPVPVLKGDPSIVPIFFIQEAWELYRNVAQVAVNIAHKGSSLEKEHYLLRSNLNEDDYYNPEFTSYDLISKFNLQALKTPKNNEDLRPTFQQDMLRIQLGTELQQPQEWMHDRCHVSLHEGTMLYVLNYFPELNFSVYQTVFEEFDHMYRSIEEVLSFYDAIVILETLACLQEDKFLRYYYTRDRLDPPEHARVVHTQLLNLVKGHPNYILLPAEDSVPNKLDTISSFIQHLAA